MGLTYMVEVKGIDKIGHVFPPPGDHLVCLYSSVSLCSEPFFNEEDLGVVIRPLREDTVTSCPRRNDIERHPDAFSPAVSMCMKEPRILSTHTDQDQRKSVRTVPGDPPAILQVCLEESGTAAHDRRIRQILKTVSCRCLDPHDNGTLPS